MGDQSEKLQVQTATILIVEGQGDQAKTKSQGEVKIKFINY